MLSRDFHLRYSQLTQLIFMLFLKHIPSSFNMCHLPKEITSCITRILESLPVKNQEQMRPTPSLIGALLAGSDFLYLQDEEMMRSWIKSRNASGLFYSASSQVPSGQESLADNTSSSWERVRSTRPWNKQLRSSQQTFGMPPGMTTGKNQVLSCRDRSKSTRVNNSSKISNGTLQQNSCAPPATQW